jgi:hypothetical protein
MSLERITELQTERARVYQQLKHDYNRWIRARELFLHFESIYLHNELLWRTLDRQLAMLDGRFKIEEPAASGHRSKIKEAPEPELTEEQINRLCKKFGIKLEEPEDLGIPDEKESLELSDNPLDQ